MSSFPPPTLNEHDSSSSDEIIVDESRLFVERSTISSVNDTSYNEFLAYVRNPSPSATPTPSINNPSVLDDGAAAGSEDGSSLVPHAQPCLPREPNEDAGPPLPPSMLAMSPPLQDASAKVRQDREDLSCGVEQLDATGPPLPPAMMISNVNDEGTKTKGPPGPEVIHDEEGPVPLSSQDDLKKDTSSTLVETTEIITRPDDVDAADEEAPAIVDTSTNFQSHTDPDVSLGQERGIVTEEISQGGDDAVIQRAAEPTAAVTTGTSQQGDEEELRAWRVDDEVFQAEPLPPWWKQKNARILICLIISVVIGAAVAIGILFTSSGDDDAETEGATIQKFELSTAPSSSLVPSASPTSCALATINSVQSFDLPLNDPVSIQFQVEGRNAVVLAREGTTLTSYIVFYLLNDDDVWVRTGIFTETSNDLIEGGVFLLYSQPVMLGQTTLIGFPQTKTNAGSLAGVVYVFEQNDEGQWERLQKPLIPDSGGAKNAMFGHSISMDGPFASIGAYYERAFYIFENIEGKWTQRLRHDVGYLIFGCYLKGNTILSLDFLMSELNLYKYDQDLNKVEVLQEPFKTDPGTRDHGGAVKKVFATGSASALLMARLSHHHLVFVTRNITVYDDGVTIEWNQMEGVHIYYRQSKNGPFSSQAFLNSSQYESGFGYEIALDDDILLVSGNNSTRVFSEQDGLFEESFALEGGYERLRLSQRQVLVAPTSLDEVSSINLEDCSQPMPTQQPSTSFAPTGSSIIPSFQPTISFGPSKSLSPSHDCNDAWIMLSSDGAIDGFQGEFISWKFYDQETEEVYWKGGPLERNVTIIQEFPCLESKRYVFEMTSSGGYGMGACNGTCGGAIGFGQPDTSGILATFGGTIVPTWFNERVTFSLPPVQREPVTAQTPSLCFLDFIFHLWTDEHPEEITYNLVDEEGETVMSGGPYEEVGMQYVEYACLQNQTYNFTMYDSGTNNSVVTGGYMIAHESYGSNILESSFTGLNFGDSKSYLIRWGDPDS